MAFDGRTTGLDVYWNCLSPYPFQVVGQKTDGFVGQDRMKIRRIVIDVAKVAVGDEFEIRTNATYLNTMQTDREQWFGVVGYSDSFKVSMLALFPAAKPFKDFTLHTARTVKEQVIPYDGAKILLSGADKDWVYWEIPTPEADRVYRLHWAW